MLLIRNFFFLSAITIFGIASTILTIYNYNPFEARGATLINFYVSLFVSLSGIITILLIGIRSRFNRMAIAMSFFMPSIRQGILLSTASVVLLFLRGIRILDYLIAISVVIVIFLLELFFQTKKVRN